MPGGQSGGAGGGPMTSEERRAQIDRQLDESFGIFDERIRGEQETIASQRGGGGSGGTSEIPDAQTGGSPDGGEGAEGTDTREGNGQGQGGESRDGQAAGQSGDQQGGGGYGGGARGGAGPTTIPADIPDGSDDDIVARQLREAAMKETDPELREKLWEEYRNYKKSTG